MHGRPLVRRQRQAPGLFDGLAMYLLDQGPLPLLFLPFALRCLVEHGLDQFASLLLQLPVTLHQLPERRLDEFASVLFHEHSSFRRNYTPLPLVGIVKRATFIGFTTPTLSSSPGHLPPPAFR